MPIIKSAIKKLRKDRKRVRINDQKRLALRRSIKKAKKSKKEMDVRAAISLIDKASKNHLIHKNKAARLKSTLAKLKISKSPSSKIQKKKKVTKPSTKTKNKPLQAPLQT